MQDQYGSGTSALVVVDGTYCDLYGKVLFFATMDQQSLIGKAVTVTLLQTTFDWIGNQLAAGIIDQLEHSRERQTASVCVRPSCELLGSGIDICHRAHHICGDHTVADRLQRRLSEPLLALEFGLTALSVLDLALQLHIRALGMFIGCGELSDTVGVPDAQSQRVVDRGVCRPDSHPHCGCK